MIEPIPRTPAFYDEMMRVEVVGAQVGKVVTTVTGALIEVPPLTKRHLEQIRCAALGMTGAEMNEHMIELGLYKSGTPPNTTDKNLWRTQRSFAAHTHSELVRLSFRAGLLRTAPMTEENTWQMDDLDDAVSLEYVRMSLGWEEESSATYENVSLRTISRRRLAAREALQARNGPVAVTIGYFAGRFMDGFWQTPAG
jgi:hypothetical protein